MTMEIAPENRLGHKVPQTHGWVDVLQGLFHGVELLDVSDLEPHGLRPGVAHDQQGESVTGHVVGGGGLPSTGGEGILVRGRLEPKTANLRA